MFDDILVSLMNSLNTTNNLVNCMVEKIKVYDSMDCFVKEGLVDVINRCSMNGCQTSYEQGPLFADKILPLAAVGGLALAMAGFTSYRLKQRLDALAQAERAQKEVEEKLANAIVKPKN